MTKQFTSTLCTRFGSLSDSSLSLGPPQNPAAPWWTHLLLWQNTMAGKAIGNSNKGMIFFQLALLLRQVDPQLKSPREELCAWNLTGCTSKISVSLNESTWLAWIKESQWIKAIIINCGIGLWMHNATATSHPLRIARFQNTHIPCSFKHTRQKNGLKKNRTNHHTIRKSQGKQQHLLKWVFTTFASQLRFVKDGGPKKSSWLRSPGESGSK